MVTQIVAHRGDRKNAPENTISAFCKALEFPELDVLEIDVHLTKDRQLVVIHDEKIDRTTNGTGYVKDYTLRELQKFDAGSWFDAKFNHEVIPSLDQFLQLLAEMNFQKTLLIEVKTDHIPYEGIEELLLAKINRVDHKYQVVYQSFNLQSLMKLHRLEPQVQLNALVFYPTLQVWKMVQQGVIQAINPDNRWWINRLFWWQKNHVSPWTVNAEIKMRRVFKARLKRIITDEIALAIKLRKEIQG